jgi:hypothetical protein
MKTASPGGLTIGLASFCTKTDKMGAVPSPAEHGLFRTSGKQILRIEPYEVPWAVYSITSRWRLSAPQQHAILLFSAACHSDHPQSKV